MFEQLFGSKTRVKLLQLFFTNPNRSFYVREITRKVDEQINSVRRELSNLLSIGIITSDANNNRLYYEVNQKYEFYKPLSQIFSKVATSKEEIESDPAGGKAKTKVKPSQPNVVEHPLAKDIRAIGRVNIVIFTGQFTRDEQSGIDILMVGDINQAKATRFISELEKTENKELRYAIIPLDNYLYRVEINDRFINNVMASKKQVIINDTDQKIK